MSDSESPDLMPEADESKFVPSPVGGGGVWATPESAARARVGKAEKRRQRQEAAARTARDVLARMAETQPPETVRAFAIRKGGAYLIGWALLLEKQAELAMSGQRGSTGAVRLIGEAAELLATRKDRGDVVALTGGLDSPEMRELLDLYRAWKATKQRIEAGDGSTA